MRSSPNPDEVKKTTRPGMPKRRYPIDGTYMTVDQIAAMLGVTVRALYNQHSLHKTSYQNVADMYRRGLIRAQGKGGVMHMVHGVWMTIDEAARRCGASRATLDRWRTQHPRPDGRRALVEAAFDHYIRQGGPQRGSTARRHRIRGMLLTERECAAMLGVDEKAFRNRKQRLGSVRAAFDFYAARRDAARIADAQRAIMKTLGYED